MKELETYSEEFNALTSAVHAASLEKDPLYGNKYSLVLYDEIKEVPPVRPLELCDIEQQLRLFWFVFINKYHTTKPQITLRQYLLRRSIWALRDWYRWIMKPAGPSHENKIKAPEFPFKLDVYFLIRGSDIHPFSLLSPYQRYILYLKYKEGKSTKEIASIVLKTRKTVGLELRRTIKFLRMESKNAS